MTALYYLRELRTVHTAGPLAMRSQTHSSHCIALEAAGPVAC